jgi:diacylglycerol kinase family enzyme
VGTDEQLSSRTPKEIPEGRPCLIVRPADGGGAVGRQLDDVVGFLRANAARPVVVEARRRGEGSVRAGELLDAGARFLVSVGGDALAREVVAGIMEHPACGEATMSVLGAGSDCDFVKTFGLPPDAASAAPRLLTGAEYPIDVLRVTCATPDGGTRVTHFAGLAEVGLGAAATRRAARLPGWLGRGRYFVSFWWTMATFRVPELRVRADEREYRGRAHEVIVGNTQHAHGGIAISPRSFPGDGVADVLVMRGPRSDHYTLLPKMFWGEQLPNPGVVELRARERVEVDGTRRVWVQADGEPLGTTPAVFEVLPQALRLKV